VLARINRQTLQAIRPPGVREWLIPVTGADDASDYSETALIHEAPAPRERPGA
jgi:hypothetical protein